MTGHIAPQVKNKRSEELQTVGKIASKNFFEANRGKITRVLIEELDEERSLMTGYTGNYIKVYVNLNNNDDFLNYQNEFVNVWLGDNFEEGMMGEINE